MARKRLSVGVPNYTKQARQQPPRGAAALVRVLRQKGIFGIRKDAYKKRWKDWAIVSYFTQNSIVSSIPPNTTGLLQGKTVGTAPRNQMKNKITICKACPNQTSRNRRMSELCSDLSLCRLVTVCTPLGPARHSLHPNKIRATANDAPPAGHIFADVAPTCVPCGRHRASPRPSDFIIKGSTFFYPYLRAPRADYIVY